MEGINPSSSAISDVDSLIQKFLGSKILGYANYPKGEKSMDTREPNDEEMRKVILAREIGNSEHDMLLRVALELIEKGKSQFEFNKRRFLLSMSGLSHNPGYQIESEELDGSNLFRHSWSSLNGDKDWQVKSITTNVSRLLASQISNE